jgi:flagellar basal body L-ring protein FlgH
MLRRSQLAPLAITLVLPPLSFAQDPAAPDTTRTEPSTTVAPDNGPTATQVMQRNGGSLLRAQMSVVAGIPPELVRRRREYDAVSFMALPAPEPRVIRKHDLVTIIVREQTEYSSDGSSDMKKDENYNATLSEFIRLNLGNLELEPAVGAVKPRIALQGKRDVKGSGSIDRKDRFITRVQSEVVDIKPNGNVILQARSRIQTDDEVQNLTISGIIRAQDITPDNTILSTQMYDMELNKQTEGNIREANRRGWFSRLLDTVSPF